jgi:hypothetical protein
MAIKSGLEMLLGQIGIDPRKIMEDFVALKDGVIGTLKSLDGRMAVIEKEQQRMQRMEIMLEDLCRIQGVPLPAPNQHQLQNQPQLQLVEKQVAQQ